MPIVVTVTRPSLAKNPYHQFQTAKANQLLQLYKEGAQLLIWRCSTPWNYYLETAKGEQYLLKGGQADALAFGANTSVLGALLHLSGEPIQSERKITRSISKLELGLPEKSCYQFDAAKAASQETEWNNLQAKVNAYRARAKPPRLDLTKLSPTAIALLRTLKANNAYNRPALERPIELEAIFAELDKQGLLTQLTNGLFRLADSVPRLKLPRGKHLQFDYR